jgi:hypothetical protein
VAKDWLAALRGAKPEPLPPWPDRKAEPPLPRGKELLSVLAALGVGPLAKPHLSDESPDGKRRVIVTGGNQIVIATPGASQSAVQPPPHSSPITSSPVLGRTRISLSFCCGALLFCFLRPSSNLNLP